MSGQVDISSVSLTLTNVSILSLVDNDVFNIEKTQLSCIVANTCYVVDLSTSLSYTIPILGIFYPILTLLTTIVNSIIIHILLRPTMQSPTNILLAAIAGFDMATLIIQAPWHFYTYTLGMHSTTHWTSSTCYLLELCTQTLPQVCHTTANWLTMGLSAQRYVYICQPHLAKRWCSVRRSSLGVLAAFCLAVLHTVSRTFDRNYTTNSKDDCVIEMAAWVNTISPNVYFNCFFWFRVIFIQCLPCLLVTIFNGYLLETLKNAQKIQTELLTRSSTVRKTNRTTHMLVILNAVFLLVEVPLSVLTVLHTISSSVHEFLDYEIVNKVMLFLNLLIVVSYPVNFAIYCSLSSQFLAAFQSLVTDTLKIFSQPEKSRRKKSYQRCASVDQTINTTMNTTI